MLECRWITGCADALNYHTAGRNESALNVSVAKRQFDKWFNGATRWSVLGTFTRRVRGVTVRCREAESVATGGKIYVKKKKK